MLPHAPSVQMADIPPDGIAIKEDTDDADPDKRNPQQLKDKQIEHENEFEEAKSGNKNIATAKNGSKDEPMEVDGATARRTLRRPRPARRKPEDARTHAKAN